MKTFLIIATSGVTHINATDILHAIVEAGKRGIEVADIQEIKDITNN